MTSSTQDLAGARPSPAPLDATTPTPGLLGRARARWDDYRGTAAADDAIALLGSRSLYEIAGLDRGTWTIVGLDASLAPAREAVVVYAVDRTAEPAGRDWLGVTAFHLSPSTRVEQFLQEAFQSVSIRLVSTLSGDRELWVDEHVELSPEG